MPNDVKAIVSVIAIIVAAILAYWSGSPVRPEYATFLMVTAVFMVAALGLRAVAGDVSSCDQVAYAAHVSSPSVSRPGYRTPTRIRRANASGRDFGALDR